MGLLDYQAVMESLEYPESREKEENLGCLESRGIQDRAEELLDPRESWGAEVILAPLECLDWMDLMGQKGSRGIGGKTAHFAPMVS